MTVHGLTPELNRLIWEYAQDECRDMSLIHPNDDYARMIYFTLLNEKEGIAIYYQVKKACYQHQFDNDRECSRCHCIKYDYPHIKAPYSQFGQGDQIVGINFFHRDVKEGLNKYYRGGNCYTVEYYRKGRLVTSEGYYEKGRPLILVTYYGDGKYSIQRDYGLDGRVHDVFVDYLGIPTWRTSRRYNNDGMVYHREERETVMIDSMLRKDKERFPHIRI